ncbi:neuropeptide receptor 22-like [Clytia hemisphaerica]|uniref:neuropeptide receptor 22-like n=1 Tax=Clytia hemisphaerica TaxID=252671 RepID=UPI0034D40857
MANRSMNNLTEIIQAESHPPLLENLGIIPVLVLLFSGISLNGCFIVAYLRRSVSASHFNFCMFHLSISNFLQLLLFLPYAVSNVSLIPHDENWVVESILCTIVRGLGFFWIAAVSASWILCYMSVLRLRLISSPLQRFKITKKRSSIVFAVIWILAIFLWSPFFFSKKLNDDQTKCIRYYERSPILFHFHSRFVMFAGFWAPLSINLTAYTAIVIRMYRREGEQTHVNSNRHRKRVIIVLGILNTIFVVCWLPMLLQWALTVTDIIKGHEKQQLAYKYCTIPCLAAGTLNIVCSINSRAALKRLVCCTRKTTDRSSCSVDSIK